jgi:ABC-type lipoprotein export system ATPase subunit
LLTGERHFLAIEAKAGKGKTTALQDAHIERIQKAGGTAVIINEQNIDTLPALLGSMR